MPILAAFDLSSSIKNSPRQVLFLVILDLFTSLLGRLGKKLGEKVDIEKYARLFFRALPEWENGQKAYARTVFRAFPENTGSRGT